MADLTKLVEVLLQALPALARDFVAEVDRLVALRPELADEWAAVRPVFVQLQDAGALKVVLESAIAGALAAIITGKGTIGKGSHGRF